MSKKFLNFIFPIILTVQVWLVPVSPSFPTKLNQTLVTCPTLVKHGDLIGVGERLLYVDVSGGGYALETAGGSCDSETSQQISHVDTVILHFFFFKIFEFFELNLCFFFCIFIEIQKRSKVPVYRHALQPDMAGPVCFIFCFLLCQISKISKNL